MIERMIIDYTISNKALLLAKVFKNCKKFLMFSFSACQWSCILRCGVTMVTLTIAMQSVTQSLSLILFLPLTEDK